MKSINLFILFALSQLAFSHSSFAAAKKCLELGKLPIATCKKAVGDKCMAFEGCVQGAAKSDSSCRQRMGQLAFQVAACKTCAAAEADINSSYDACMASAPATPAAPANSSVPKVPSACSPSPAAELFAFNQNGSCSGTNCPCTYKPCDGTTPSPTNPMWGTVQVTNGVGKPETKYCTERSCKLTQPVLVTCFVAAS